MKYNDYDYSDYDLECLEAELLPDEDSEYWKNAYNELESFLEEYYETRL